MSRKQGRRQSQKAIPKGSRKQSRKRAPQTPARAVAAYLAKLGRRGGTARAKNLTAEERRAGAQKAAEARWAKRPT
jgi:hypothetical protein